MATINNDERILELKKQIENKKEKIGKASRFAPITNCSIELDNMRYNINVLNNEGLMMLLVKLNMLRLSAVDLKIVDKFVISGYKINDWIEDINSKLNILNKKDEERQLKIMEEKLTKLLSDDKKVELEIDEIESMLND